MSKTLFLRLRKTMATVLSNFHPRLQSNFQKLLRFHREENLQHGLHQYTVRWQNLLTDKLQEYYSRDIITRVFNISATLQKMLHCQRKTCYTQKFVHVTAMQ